MKTKKADPKVFVFLGALLLLTIAATSALKKLQDKYDPSGTGVVSQSIKKAMTTLWRAMLIAAVFCVGLSFVGVPSLLSIPLGALTYWKFRGWSVARTSLGLPDVFGEGDGGNSDELRAIELKGTYKPGDTTPRGEDPADPSGGVMQYIFDDVPRFTDPMADLAPADVGFYFA